MANEAEVDLVVNAAGALPDLERQLNRIVQSAERTAPDVALDASLDIRNTLRTLDRELGEVVSRAERDRDNTIDLRAVLDQRRTLRALDASVGRAVAAVSRGADPIDVEAVLDRASLARLRASVDAAVELVERTADPIELDVDVDVDEPLILRLARGLGRVGAAGTRASAGVLPLVGAGARLGLVMGSLANVLPVVVGTLAQVAPAAAVASQAMLAMRLAAVTTQVAMIGVSEAIETAFDPEAKPEDLQKAIERLAPEAQKFVLALRGMRGELTSIQQGVQNRVFRDLDDSLRSLGQTTGPVVTLALNQTANSLNRMARETVNAANELSQRGILGAALEGATTGLQNLEKVPGRVTRSIAALAAGAAPAFDRITRGIDKATESLQDRLLRALEDGRLTAAIDRAVGLFGQLLTIVGNFGEGVGNIFEGLSGTGGGLFDVLEKISEAFVRLTASSEFQSIMEQLGLTVGELVDTALPLLEEAFRQLAPVVEELAPVVREFIREVGPELIPVIQELGPLLVDLAIIMKEQLPVAIEITQRLLQILTFVLGGLHKFMQNFVIPIVRKVAEIINSDFVRSLDDAVNAVREVVPAMGREFLEFADQAIRAFTEVIDDALDFVNDFNSRVGQRIAEIVTGIAQDISELPGRILDSFASLPSQMYSVGTDIMAGLLGGMRALFPDVTNLALEIASTVVDTISGAFDIASPSRVMKRIGEFVGEGFIQGIVGERRAIETAVQRTFIDPIHDPFNERREVGRRAGTTVRSVALPFDRSSERPINVYVGNELLGSFVDGRLADSDYRNRRTAALGVRR